MLILLDKLSDFSTVLSAMYIPTPIKTAAPVIILARIEIKLWRCLCRSIFTNCKAEIQDF